MIQIFLVGLFVIVGIPLIILLFTLLLFGSVAYTDNDDDDDFD